MNALVWRLHRNQAYIAAGTLALIAIALAITGGMVARDYRSFLSSCAATQNCPQTSLVFGRWYVFTDLTELTIAVPALFGLFWGAPLLAREFEENTHTLVWTQGVTRARWLNANVGWFLGGAALWGAAISALVMWWRSPETAAAFHGPRLSPRAFDIQGIVPIAYAICAVAIGIAAGALIRRVMPALAVTLALFAGARVAVMNLVRPHLLTPVSKVLPFNKVFDVAKSGEWLLSRTYLNESGRTVGARFTLPDIPAACHPGNVNGGGLPACLTAHGWHVALTYQPASRFWPFQWMEAGMFLTLAAVLLLITYRVALRRDA
ncbi:MAG TPA: ABC transporter permease [Actinomycetota bacterium]|nr:ABC transporter permease [Actinomycetota bacterium]